MPISLLNIAISTLVVVAILIVYRQLDRNNRSLGKVKRYSDRVQKSLAEFVDEKTTEIKDLSIELQVNLKTGTEILNRIKGMEQDLRSKSGDVQEIKSQVGNYDSVLKELVSMTAKVEENLKRIHAESGFVDTLGKRIKDSSLRMVQIEKQVPEILNDLNRNNLEALESAVHGMKTTTEERINALAVEVRESESRVKDFSSYITRLESRRDSIESETVKNLENLSESIILKADERRTAIIDEMQSKLDRMVAETESKRTELVDSINSVVDSSKEELLSLEENHVKRLNEFDSDLAAIELNYKKRLDNAAQRGESLEHEAFLSIKSLIDQDVRKLEEEIGAEFKDIADGLESGKKDLVEVFGKTRSDVTVWQAEISQRMKESLEQIESTEQEIDQRTISIDETIALHRKNSQAEMESARKDVATLKSNLLAEIESIEVKTIEIIEKRLEDYEGDALYRFGKLEQVNSDIELLEQNLRQVMERLSSRLKDDFDAFVEFLEDKRTLEQKRTDEVIGTLRGDMAMLEKGLSELKTKAYQDVSAKLRGFEDEFLADLSKRSRGMEESLQLWQKSVRDQINQIAESHVSEREKIESSYKKGLATNVSRLEEDYEKELQVVKDALKVDLKNLDEELSEGKQGLLGQLNLAEQEVSKWKERIEQELNKSKTTFNDRFVTFSDVVDTTIGGLREEFYDQRDEMIVQTREERDGLRKELGAISSRVSELKKHLTEKTASVFELFKRRQDEFEIEFKLKSQDLKGEIDDQVRDFKMLVSDIEEKSNVLQEKLSGKIEEEYKLLSQKLSNLERQQKDFVSQTKLFDRADKLKLDLERNIGELRKNLMVLEPQRKDMRIIEGEFKNTQKLVDEVAAKLTRFQAERRRVEDLEKNFDRLISLSYSIEQKLSDVNSSNDAIEGLQIKIRDLKAIEEEVEERYDRLDKKKALVDTTTDGVEKNFNLLEALEKSLKHLDSELKQYPDQVEEIRNQVKLLSQNKGRAETAVEKMEVLDESLAEIEERMDKLQKAREWLAKTETRLESVNKQAQENITLLRTLAKAEADHNKDLGAPPSDKRQMVIKLAKLGWSSKEIAQRTNISRGEVELILELAPQSK